MDWPATYTVATPSGGWHLYFTAPGGPGIRNSASLIGPQVDVRAAGGYVVAAGSTVGGREYDVIDDADPAPLPAWIARLLAPKATPTTPARERQSTPAGRLSGLLRTVESAPVGRRNDALFWASCRAAEMIAEGRLAPDSAAGQLADAAAAAGLPEPEARRTIASALRGEAR
jgi:hypothetical protein